MSLSQLCVGLKAAIQRDPLTHKVLLAPTMAQGNQLLERICLEGSSWLNVRVATLRSMALDIASLKLAEERLSFANATTTRGAVEAVLAERVRATESYFHGMRPTGGLVEAVHQAVQDLRMGGLSEKGLPAGAFETAEKHGEIVAVLSSYCNELASINAVDEADVFRIALQAVAAADQPEPGTRYLVTHGLCLNALSRRFFDALVRPRAIILSGPPVRGIDPPRRTVLSEPTVPETRLSYLFAPQEKPAELASDVELDLFHASSPTNELREVVRRILTEGIGLDEVEVVATDTETYGAALHNLTLKLELECTLADGLPLARTRPGRAVAALLSWIEGGFFVEPMRRAIAAGDIDLPEHEGDRPSNMGAARFLRSIGIGWGRERYLPMLASAFRRAERDLNGTIPGGDEAGEKRALTIKRRLSCLTVLRTLFRGLLDAVPPPHEDGKVRLASMIQAVRDFVDRNARCSTEPDTAARAAILDVLDELRGFGERDVPIADATDAVRTALATVRVQASGPRPGSVHLSHFRRGGCSGRPRTFVVGLDESRFPGKGLQNPILLDRERQALSDDLPTSGEALSESLHAMASMFARLRGKVTVSYAGYDPLDNRPVAPCSVVLQAFRLASGDDAADYTKLMESLGALHGTIPGGDRCLDATDVWFRALAEGPVLADGLKRVRAEYPGLAAGMDAEDARDSDAVTSFDGKIQDCEELDPRGNDGIVMSCSRIERLASCPHAYFLRYVLGIKKPDEVEYDPTGWLDPLMRGCLLHDVFCRYMRQLRQHGGKSGPDTLPMAIEVLQQVAAEYEDVIPSPSDQVMRFEMKELEDSVRVFHRIECGRGEGTPRFFEAAFGFGEEPTAGEVGSSDPLRIELGTRKWLLLRGRVDRIDELSPGKFVVLDYKTGRATACSDHDYFLGGRQVQHALYALAAEQFLKTCGVHGDPKVVKAGYVFPTVRGEGRRLLRDQDRRADLTKLMNALCDAIRSGCFVASPDARSAGCDYCDYAEACGASLAAERSKRKADAGARAMAHLLEAAEYV